MTGMVPWPFIWGHKIGRGSSSRPQIQTKEAGSEKKASSELQYLYDDRRVLCTTCAVYTDTLLAVGQVYSEAIGESVLRGRSFRTVSSKGLYAQSRTILLMWMIRHHGPTPQISDETQNQWGSVLGRPQSKAWGWYIVKLSLLMLWWWS